MDLPSTFGKYELLQRIATGGMAEVYLARSFGVAGFEKRLVIKRIRPELADDPNFIQMFITEAKIGVHLNHPNVVQVYELGRVGPMYYIAMEHLHGKDLTRLVKTLRAGGQKLDLPLACWVVAETLRGLAHAHGRNVDGSTYGVVHQDVSPHNILVTFEGDVKLVDFGIARLVNTAEGHTAEGDEAPAARPGGGKYAYMSPEQALGLPMDHRTDIFSAGIVLWELIVGHRLFQDKNPEEKLRKVQEAVIPHPSDEGVEVDDGLWQILCRALSKDLDHRYPNARLFEEDLRAWLFENRHHVGQKDVAHQLGQTFPDAVDPSFNDAQLHRLVADVERLEAAEPTGSLGTPSSRSNDGTPVPRRLPVALGERKPVSVVMVDLDGLTDLSARIDPEGLFMRNYQILRWCRRIVDRYGGRLQSAVDDHVTLFFGVPRTRVEDTVNAVECALELQRRAPELRTLGMAVELAIGVHHGEVTLSTGPGRQLRYIARGDTTRLARKLSAVADHGEVLVSERVMERVEGAFLMTRGTPVPSRGGKDPILSLRVEGRRSGLRAAGRGPWVRRGNELEVLRDGLVHLANGDGAAIVLGGAIGTGKSRLIREVRDLARRRGMPFYGARCAPMQALRPMEGFMGLLLQLLGAEPNLSPVQVAPHLERLNQLGLTQRDVEVLGTLFGVAPRHAPDRSELWRALRRTFTGLAQEGPCILALDDVHELSQSNQLELRRLIEETAQVPALWLLSANSTLLLGDTVETVTLGQMTDEALRRLLCSLLSTETVDESLVQLVARTCEGNPLYTEEMVKYLIEQERVTVSDGHASLHGPDVRPQLPTTLAQLIAARIDALDPASKGTLQLAAVIGPEFSQVLVSEAVGLDDATPLLANLASHGLVQRVEHGHFSFSSPLIHEGVLRGILRVQRSDYNRMVAAAIESVHEDALDSWSESLAHHCAAGGRPIDAARYANQAGQHHEQEFALERAAAMYLMGIEALSQADRSPDTWDARTQGEATLSLARGRVLLAMGEQLPGMRALQLALDISADAGLPWVEVEAHVQLGRSYLERGRLGLAEAHLGQARALLRLEDEPELEQEVLEAAAVLAHEQGKNDEAEELWRQALSHAEDNPTAEARCRIGLANRYLRAGRYDEAQPLLDSALVATRAVEDRILEGRVLNNLGLLHSWAGRHDDALAFYRRSLEVREGMGYLRGVVVNHHNIADTHFQLGDWSRAHVAFTRSRDLATDMGWDHMVALNQVYLAYIEASEGQGDLARILQATEQARQLDDAEITTTGGWLAGRFLAEQERPDEARQQLDRAMEDARKWDLVPMIELIEETLAQL